MHFGLDLKYLDRGVLGGCVNIDANSITSIFCRPTMQQITMNKNDFFFQYSNPNESKEKCM